MVGWASGFVLFLASFGLAWVALKYEQAYRAKDNLTATFYAGMSAGCLIAWVILLYFLGDWS
jgi:uncharacterized iron-regulated membrane protein